MRSIDQHASVKQSLRLGKVRSNKIGTNSDLQLLSSSPSTEFLDNSINTRFKKPKIKNLVTIKQQGQGRLQSMTSHQRYSSLDRSCQVSDFIIKGKSGGLNHVHCKPNPLILERKNLIKSHYSYLAKLYQIELKTSKIGLTT